MISVFEKLRFKFLLRVQFIAMVSLDHTSKNFERHQDCSAVSPLFVNSTALLSLSCLFHCTAFFPGTKSQDQTCFTVLERDLSTVHPALFSSLDDIGRSQVEQLLGRLGVKSWSARELINSHIIPTFKSSKWKVTHEICSLTFHTL